MHDGTTILFGLPGVTVREVGVAADDTRTVHVVTADPGAAACPVCGVLSTSVRQHRVECIRRHYLNQGSPLADTLSLYADFFALFGDFRGYWMISSPTRWV